MTFQYGDAQNFEPTPRDDVDGYMAGRGGLFTDLPATPLAPAAPVTKALPLGFVGETVDASAWRGGDAAGIDRMWSKFGRDPDARFTSVATSYWDAAKRADHGLKVAGGKLLDQDDVAADTSAASGIGTQRRAGEGRHIFALGSDDSLTAADPWAEHDETARPGRPGESHLGMINHSSLVEGGSVKAAGELKIDDGKLQEVSDSSGHYTPTNAMTRQALDHFDGAGVDLHDVGVKLMDKGSGQRVAMYASAREFMGTQDAMRRRNDIRAASGQADEYDLSAPAAVEAQMLDARARMKLELGQKLAARQARIAGGGMKMTGGAASADMQAAAATWAAEAEGGAAPAHEPAAGPQPYSLERALRAKLSARASRLATGTALMGGEEVEGKRASVLGAGSLFQNGGKALPVGPHRGKERTHLRLLKEARAERDAALAAAAAVAAAQDDDSDDSDSDSDFSASDTSETGSSSTSMSEDDDWDAEADGDLDDIFEEASAEDMVPAAPPPPPGLHYGAQPYEDLFQNQY